MDALSVISVADAKTWLIIEDDADNAPVERLIKSAIAWIEKYTCYRLYARDETFISTSCKTDLPYFPINSKSIKLKDDTVYNPTDSTYFYGALSLIVNCPVQATISLNTGYAAVTDIPSPLIEAAYKLITYLYENRDAYSTVLPLDVQILINEYRRSPTI